MSAEFEIAILQARVFNLEMALHAMWAMIQDTHPPAVQESVQRVMHDHFEATEVLMRQSQAME